MKRDPSKKITAFCVGLHDGEVRPILLVNDIDRLVVASNGLSQEQAELLCDGYVDGLRESTELPVSLIAAFLDDAEAIAALEVPLDGDPAERELFKQGTIGGLRLAAAGYWIDVGEPVESRTIH
jgi:hypothetical protein